MICSRCGECCRETEMLLSNEDIERFEKKGYNRNEFARFDREGYAILRNKDGNCFFFDIARETCKERTIRPYGCRVYPVVFDEDHGIIVDEFCPARKTFSEGEKERIGKHVLKFLKKIDVEAKDRLLARR